MAEGIEVYMEEIIRSFALQMAGAAVGPGPKNQGALFSQFDTLLRQLAGMAREPLRKQLSDCDTRMRQLEARVRQLEK